MAFGNITTLYIPTAANAGASQRGTDVRKLLDAADAGADATTITNHGTGTGEVERVVDPYSTSTTATGHNGWGWMVNPSDMNSVAGAKRRYPPGNFVLTTRMGHNGALLMNGTLGMYLYRIGPSPGFTPTLLSNQSASVAFPAVSGEVTAVVTVNLATETIFEPGETIQFSFGLLLAGIVIVGHTATFFTGTQSAVVSRIDTPMLGVLADTTGSASGSVAVAGVGGKVLGTVGAASGAGSAAGVLGATAGTTGSAAGSATVAGSGGSVAGTTGTAAGAATVDGQASIVLGMVGTVEIGAGSSAPVKRPIFIFDE